VVSFLQRRGDPLGQLEPGKPIASHTWLDLITVLRQAAQVWEPRTDLQLSRPIADSAEPAAGFLRALNPAWEGELGVTYRGLQPIVVAKSLAAYCVACAAAALRQRLPMRRCDFCTGWFTVHYAAAQHCSASCRAARHNNRSSPHGFRSEDHHSQGDDSLAMPLAGAGSERMPAGNGHRTSRRRKKPRLTRGACGRPKIAESAIPGKHDLASYLKEWLAHHRQRGDFGADDLARLRAARARRDSPHRPHFARKA
jgi:hypothetical protein